MIEIKIGKLADRAGTNAPTIRYYEEIGLLRARLARPADSASMTTMT